MRRRDTCKREHPKRGRAGLERGEARPRSAAACAQQNEQTARSPPRIAGAEALSCCTWWAVGRQFPHRVPLGGPERFCGCGLRYAAPAGGVGPCRRSDSTCVELRVGLQEPHVLGWVGRRRPFAGVRRPCLLHPAIPTRPVRANGRDAASKRDVEGFPRREMRAPRRSDRRREPERRAPSQGSPHTCRSTGVRHADCRWR